MWVLIICGWIFFGVLAAGWTFAYYQDEFPTIAKARHSHDFMFSLAIIPLGLLVVIVVLVGGYYEHGWRLWNKKPSHHSP